MPPRVNGHQFGEILRRLDEEGGFTYDPRTGEFPSSGYSVAAHPAAELTVTHPGGVTEAHLEGYVAGSAPIWKQQKAKGRGQEMIGGWGSTLDLPKVFPATPVGHAKSREAQVLREQKASFSLHEMAEDINPWSPRQPGDDEHPAIGKMMRGDFPEFEHALRQNRGKALEQNPEISAWTRAPLVRAEVQKAQRRR